MIGNKRFGKRTTSHPLQFRNPFYTTGFKNNIARVISAQNALPPGVNSVEARDFDYDYSRMLQRQNAGIRTIYKDKMRKVFLNEALRKRNRLADWLVQMITETEDMDGIPDERQRFIIDWTRQISDPAVREYVLAKLQERLDKSRVPRINTEEKDVDPMSAIEGPEVPDREAEVKRQEQDHDDMVERVTESYQDNFGKPPSPEFVKTAVPDGVEPVKEEHFSSGKYDPVVHWAVLPVDEESKKESDEFLGRLRSQSDVVVPHLPPLSDATKQVLLDLQKRQQGQPLTASDSVRPAEVNPEALDATRTEDPGSSGEIVERVIEPAPSSEEEPSTPTAAVVPSAPSASAAPLYTPELIFERLFPTKNINDITKVEVEQDAIYKGGPYKTIRNIILKAMDNGFTDMKAIMNVVAQYTSLNKKRGTFVFDVSKIEEVLNSPKEQFNTPADVSDGYGMIKGCGTIGSFDNYGIRWWM